MSVDVSVVFERVILELISDPTVSVICGSAGRGDSFVKEGTFRNYANGRTRLILGTGTNRILPVTLRALSPTQVTTLKSMIGKTCLFRDTYGRRVWCSFLATDITDIPLSGKANDDLMTDISISLTEIDYDEEV